MSQYWPEDHAVARHTGITARIADTIREQISSGVLPPGAQLATQKALAGEYKVDRTTVRRAVDQLVAEGLIDSRPPRGMFVREQRRIVVRPQAEFGRPPSEVMDWFMGHVEQQGGEPSQTINVALVQAPALVAERLRLADDEQVVVLRQRVRSVDGERFNLNDTYYPRALVAGSEIESPVDIARGANAVLAELGYEQQLTINEFTARGLTPDEGHRLGLGPGTKALEWICTGYTGDSTESLPVRCVVNVMPGDRQTIVVELRRPAE
jgi:DNA-binding GntR family transcriptional regulator